MGHQWLENPKEKGMKTGS